MRDADDGGGQQAEVYTYESSSLVYGMNWSVSTAVALCAVSACTAWEGCCCTSKPLIS